MKPETQRDPGRAPRPAFLAELFESLTDRTRHFEYPKERPLIG